MKPGKGARRALGIKDGELSSALLLFVMSFCATAVTIAGKSARDTYFLSRFPKFYLPIMFLACAVVVALASWLISRTTQHVSRKTLLDVTVGIAIGAVLVSYANLSGWVIPAIYIWVDIIVLVVVLQLWLEAGRIFDARQARRLFALIAAGGSVAAIIIGSSLKGFAKSFGSESILIGVAGLLAVYWVFGRLSMRQFRPGATQTRRQTSTAGFHVRDPYIVWFALLVAASALVTQVVDYQFKLIAATSFENETNLVGYFGHFYAATGAATLLFQFFLTSRLLSLIGLSGCLAVVPFSLGSASIATLLHPGLAFASMAKFSDQTLKFTLHNAATELLWLPLPPLVRSAVRPMISGTVKSCAEGVAGVLLFVSAGSMTIGQLGVISVCAAAVWLGAALRMRGLYSVALANAIQEQRLDSEGLSIDVRDPETLSIIKRALHADNEKSKLVALDLVRSMTLGPWRDTLQQMISHSSENVRNRIFEIAGDEPDIVTDELILSALNAEGGQCTAAMRLAGERRLKGATARLSQYVESASPEMRAAACKAILQVADGPVEIARSTLGQMLNSPQEREQIAGITTLSDQSDILSADKLDKLLLAPSPDIREAALRASVKRASVHLSSIVVNLGDVLVARTARETLRTLPPSEVVNALAETLSSANTTRALRVGIVRCLSDYPSAESIRLIVSHVSPVDPRMANHCATSLLIMARSSRVLQRPPEVLFERGLALAKEAYRAIRMQRLLPNQTDTYLLHEHYEQTRRVLVPALLKLGALRNPQAPIEACVHVLDANDVARLPFVLEFLDGMFARLGRRVVQSLVEPLPIEARDAVGQELFSDLPGNLRSELERLASAPDGWESTLSLAYLLRHSAGESKYRVDSLQSNPSELVTEILRDTAAFGNMYTTLEKTIILKSINLFEGIPAEKLSRVARICHEARFHAGETVVKEGDAGDSLFVVIEGVVRIHKADVSLRTLRAGECFGEMALLDHSTRSASATVSEDAILLEIGQEEFFEVMAANPEILQPIIRLLTRRLRDANERLFLQATA